jgi:hypothetical protein
MPCLKAEQELRWLLRTLDTVRQEVSPKSHERYSEIVNNNLVPAYA